MTSRKPGSRQSGGVSLVALVLDHLTSCDLATALPGLLGAAGGVRGEGVGLAGGGGGGGGGGRGVGGADGGGGGGGGRDAGGLGRRMEDGAGDGGKGDGGGGIRRRGRFGGCRGLGLRRLGGGELLSEGVGL